jgi:hypothetical protein
MGDERPRGTDRIGTLTSRTSSPEKFARSSLRWAENDRTTSLPHERPRRRHTEPDSAISSSIPATR